MEKSKFKKLALMGITGGIILASQSPVDLNASADSGFTLAAGCGKSCGAKQQNLTADAAGCSARSQSQQNRNYMTDANDSYQTQQGMQQQYPTSNSQQGMQQYPTSNPQPGMQQQYPTSSAQQGRYSSGCGARNQPYSQTASNSGCGARTQPNNQPNIAGCGARNQPSNSRNYTADNAGCGARNQPNSSRNYTADASDDMQQGNTQYPGSSQQQQQQRNQQQGRYTANADATATKNMSESDLKAQLNSDGKTTYDSLSPEGKALALKLASQTCQGKNDCKGLNSCKSAENSCAGQGSCRGTSKGPFTDKNKAVKVAAKKMAEKRSATNSY